MEIAPFYLTPAEAKKVDEAKYVNNSSVVTVVTVQGTKFQQKLLFGGDIETAGWEALLAREAFKTAVKGVSFLVTSHHGHSSGFSAELYKAMGTPLLNIVSIHHNDEHIADEYSKEEYALGVQEKYTTGIDFKGADIRRSLTTRADGSITIHVTDEGRWHVSAERLADNRKEKAAKGYL